MKVSKSTIVRTIMLVIVLINLILEKCGVDIIKADENAVLQAVEYIIEIAAIIAAWWYNNSFSKKALKAQQYLEELRKEEANV